MNQSPILKTKRLLMKLPQLSDALGIQSLVSDKGVASTTRSIPHPYESGMAETWITEQKQAVEQGNLVNFAIFCSPETIAAGSTAVAQPTESALVDTPSATTLVGDIGLVREMEHDSAELGYWIGKPFWGLGIATEAADAVVQYGFAQLRLNRIYAHYMARNPASGRVMEKIGMHREGLMRQHVKKWGEYEDVILYGLLREDWEKNVLGLSGMESG